MKFKIFDCFKIKQTKNICKRDIFDVDTERKARIIKSDIAYYAQKEFHKHYYYFDEHCKACHKLKKAKNLFWDTEKYYIEELDRLKKITSPTNKVIKKIKEIRRALKILKKPTSIKAKKIKNVRKVEIIEDAPQKIKYKGNVYVLDKTGEKEK